MTCSNCCEKLWKRCATCTYPTIIRNKGMESVIEQLEVSCPNSEFGCSEDVSYGERSRHLEKCAFAPCPCPFNTCNFTGQYKDLYEHCVAKHGESLSMFECGEPVYIHLGSGERLVLKEQSTEGGRGEVLVVERFDKPYARLYSVSCIAPDVSGIGKFSYKLELNSADTHRLSFVAKVLKVREVSGELPTKEYTTIPPYICREYKLFITINRMTY